MRTRVGWRLLAGLCVLTAVLAFGVPGALAAFHGIGVAKQCSSPVKIGDPYTCAVQILNTVDTGHDTLRVTGLSDTVLASAGPVSTGNILPSTALVFTGPVTCTGGTGTGTSADPYIGATECLLPFGSSIVTKPFSHYTVQPGDFNLPTVTQLAAPAAAGATNVKLDRTALAVGDSFTIDPNGANPETRVATAVGTSGVGGTGVSFATPLAFAHAAGVRVDLFAHRLADGATVDWNNTCTFDPDNDCTTNAQQTTVGASALVQKLASATATDIHNAAHQTVAVVDVGTTVHDFVTVSGQPTSPTPTGNVLFEWFLNGSCSGTAQSSATLGPLNGSGQFDASTFAFTPNGAGFRAFRATYLGDAIYDGSVGGCEPLQVVDANIQLTPPTATNRIGSPHVLTCHINVNDGNGFANAPAGTVCTVSIISGPGAPASQNCATDAAGSCQVTIGSDTTGLTTIRASTNVAVAGLTIHRQTGDAHVGDSADAQKLWMNARISIAPNATNEINQLHTFTVTLETDTGSGFSPAAGKTVTVTLSGINGANPNPAGPFTGTTDANGQFAVTFKSATPGKIVGHASASLSVAGSAQFTVETDASGGSSGDAVKTFVDANIQLTPATATNPIATNHTLHCHVNVNAGDGSGFVNAPAGTQCTVNIIAGPGTPATQSCTTVGATGTCDLVITSATAGTTTLQATTTVSVGSVSLTRTTGDAHAGDGPNAAKTWAGARISIAPSATNEVGQSHTFTVTLETDAGSGFGPAADGHVDVILTDASGASHTAPTGTCTDAGANTNAAGQCTITFTSNSAGTVTAHATAALSIGGQPVTVATSGVAPNSGDAVKTFVDANIQLTPATATNPLGTNHVLHCHINVNDGSGFVNAPAGTVCTVNIIAGPGTPATQNCTTIGSTGTCDATITSATAGTTTIQATTTVSVGGISLTRTTGDANAGDGPNASKTWAGARISIASSATNAVGQSHTFTVKLETDGGSGFVPAAGVHVDVTLTDANGANHAAPSGTCTNAGANTNAAGECTITFVSNTAGTVTGHASATLSIGGQQVAVSTSGVAPNSADAVKTFVDANIQIAPLTDNNPVSTNHVLTAHVNTNAGSGFASAANGTVISFALTNAGGATSAFVGANSCTTAGGTGSCSVTISSTTVGTTTVRASTTVTLNGVVLTRTTGDGRAGDSADASKTWADATVRTDILNASNAVVTTVQAGTVVHDRVFVQRAAGTPASVPNPTGTVVFHRYATGDCTGTATDQSVALAQGDPSTAVTGDFAPTGNISYKADYLGDANYPARSGACEPLAVTPVPAPAIAIVKNPKGQTINKGATARFQITVTNTGNVTLTNVTVTDPLSPNCNRTQAQIPALASMAPKAAVTYSCSRPSVQADYDNVATATGTPPTGPNVTASDTAPVKVVPPLVPPKKHPKVISHKKPKATG